MFLVPVNAADRLQDVFERGGNCCQCSEMLQLRGPESQQVESCSEKESITPAGCSLRQNSGDREDVRCGLSQPQLCLPQKRDQVVKSLVPAPEKMQQ